MRPGPRLAAVAGSLVVACLGGCGSPGGPSPVQPPWAPEGTVLTFTSGETGLPVAGGALTLGPNGYVTDGAGRVVLIKPVVTASDAVLTMKHNAFLERATHLRDATSTSFTLWPGTSAEAATYPEYTKRLVYSNDDPPAGTLPLRRLPAGTTHVSVVPSPEIQADARAMESHRAAVERMTAGTEGRIVYTLDPQPTATLVVRTVVRPDDPCMAYGAACARNESSGDQITGAELVFGNFEWARTDRVVLHELGHTYGLGHSLSPWDVMGGTYAVTFTPAEVLTMRMMWQRRAGNRWPDDDRGASAQGRRVEVFICGLGLR